MPSFESNADRELIDLTERTPPAWDECDESEPRHLPPPPRSASRSRTVPPPIPARSAPPPIPVRAAPPPIPARAAPPPIPVRAAPVSAVIAATPPSVDEASVDIDLTPTPQSELVRSSLPALPVTRPRGSGTLPPPFRVPTVRPFIVASPAPVAEAFAPRPVAPPILVARPATDETPLPPPSAEDHDELAGSAWFEASQAVEVYDEPDADWPATSDFDRPQTRTATVRGAIAILVVLGVAGIVAVAFVVTRGAERAGGPAVASVRTPAVEPAKGPAQVAVEEPAAALLPAPAASIPSVPAEAIPSAPAEVTSAVVDAVASRQVQVVSQPAGATITLVDNGTMSVLGEAPVLATLDRSRSYELVFTLEGYQTQIAHLDGDAREVAIELAASAPVKTRVPAPEKSRPQPIKQRAAPAVKRPAAKERAAAPRARVAAVAPKSGEGTLMVSAKPPCEIAIDGVATVLMTPQRALKLPAGKHTLTLFNLEHGINATIAITIEAQKTTKVIRDFTSRGRSKTAR